MKGSFGLAGKRILVTASSSGIGFGAARAFLEEGANVVINSSNHQRLFAAAKELRSLGEVHTVVADLTSRKDMERLVAESRSHLGGIDVFVYVTGPPEPGTFLEKGYREWEEAAELMVISPAYLARLVALDMVDSNTAGSMVFLASVAIREPILTIATSGVCRIAIAGLVRTLARELGPKGVRVNGILPGYIDTMRTQKIIDNAAVRKKITRSKALADLENEIPMGRLGTTKELAQVVLFLASGLSSYVSGALIPVDGAYLHSVG